MSKRLSKLEFHDCLRCSIGDRGTCTATTEVELTQQLTYLEQVPLYGVCVDLKKTYDAMDRDRYMGTLKGCRFGPKILKLIKLPWDNAELVCRASRVFGKPFKALWGVIQVGPVLTRIFNVMVDAILESGSVRRLAMKLQGHEWENRFDGFWHSLLRQ